MYERIPTQQEMEESGFAPEDFVSDPVEIYPDNEVVHRLFAKMDTQWRVGMNGPTGLDYHFALHKMDRMGLDPEAYEQIESDLRTMEIAALNEMRKK